MRNTIAEDEAILTQRRLDGLHPASPLQFQSGDSGEQSGHDHVDDGRIDARFSTGFFQSISSIHEPSSVAVDAGVAVDAVKSDGIAAVNDWPPYQDFLKVQDKVKVMSLYRRRFLSPGVEALEAQAPEAQELDANPAIVLFRGGDGKFVEVWEPGPEGEDRDEKWLAEKALLHLVTVTDKLTIGRGLPSKFKVNFWYELKDLESLSGYQRVDYGYGPGSVFDTIDSYFVSGFEANPDDAPAGLKKADREANLSAWIHEEKRRKLREFAMHFFDKKDPRARVPRDNFEILQNEDKRSLALKELFDFYLIIQGDDEKK